MSTENLLRPQASGIPRQHTGLSGQGAYNSSVNLEKLFCDGSLAKILNQVTSLGRIHLSQPSFRFA
jgi:hypothetical protein